MNTLELIGRKKTLFENDIIKYDGKICKIIQKSSFLILGAAGSIGQSLTKEIFKRNPKKLHVVDISENNLVELVRDLRSSSGYINGEFKTFALDIGSVEFEHYVMSEGVFDFIFNLSALKHVRSESDPYTLMRMINTNILNTIKSIDQAISINSKKYFCVSTDKAANPVNMMGASKRIMEMFLMQKSNNINISTSRFANVAFSDGSLLYGFMQRVQKRQPISAPQDVQRYFVTSKESGQLCLLSGLLGNNKEIFFPKLSNELNLISFDKIAIEYLINLGYEPYICDTEEDARINAEKLIKHGKWPCYFFNSDTTGEKDFEEFFTKDEKVNFDRFHNIGVIQSNLEYDDKILDYFINEINRIFTSNSYNKSEIVDLFTKLIPNFNHIEKNKYLDDKM